MSALNANDRDPFAVCLESIPASTAIYLCDELDKMIIEYARLADAINVRDNGNKPYHKGQHSREMSDDAARIKTSASHFFQKDKTKALELYVKLVQAIHAAHDIVQGKGAPANEELSAQDFVEKFSAILKENKIEENSGLLENVKNFAIKLIVDGTVFDFASKKQPIVKKCLEGKLDLSTPLTELGCLFIAMNDTTRMASVNAMLKEPETAKALKEQYDALKDTGLIKILDGREKHNRKGADLYTYTKRNLKSVGAINEEAKDSKFGNLPEKKVKAVLTFMHIFGQNLRIASEFNNGNIPAVFRGYMIDGQMPSLTDQEIDTAYNFIMEKMTSELSEKGFCQGMRWTETGIPEINKQFREKFGVKFDIFQDSYKSAWLDYIENANDVLSVIKTQVNDPQKSVIEKAETKQQFVKDCLKMARNQTGLFLMNRDEWQVKLHAGPGPGPGPGHKADI